MPAFFLCCLLIKLKVAGINVRFPIFRTISCFSMDVDQIGGTTLHSFAGLGLAKDPPEKCLGKLLGIYGKVARDRVSALSSLRLNGL